MFTVSVLNEMTFYCTRNPDGTVHVQNAVAGMLGQHHVHSKQGFRKWRKGLPKGAGRFVWLKKVDPCECGNIVDAMRLYV